jgi:hypothetical protein
MRHSTLEASEQTAMTIRMVVDDDRTEVARLAQRDSATVPPLPLLGVEVGGELLVVTSLTSGETIADPFRSTEALRAIVELRAAQLRRAGGGGSGLGIPFRERAIASLAGSPPGAGGRLLTLRT